MNSPAPNRYQHPLDDIHACRSIADAVYASMRHACMSQETLAGNIGVTPAYLSLLLNGKRPWQQRILEKVRHVTGSLATLQWAAMREGVDLYVDPIEQRKAEALRTLAEIDAMERAA